jgi:hypothetical protein
MNVDPLTMADVDPNPYASPLQASESPRTRTRWRIIPAAGSFLLGFASFAFGIFAVAVMTYVVTTRDADDMLGVMLAGCGVYLGFGACWMMAGWLYWRGRYLIALAANVAGILIPLAVIAILGVQAAT